MLKPDDLPANMLDTLFDYGLSVLIFSEFVPTHRFAELTVISIAGFSCDCVEFEFPLKILLGERPPPAPSQMYQASLTFQEQKNDVHNHSRSIRNTPYAET